MIELITIGGHQTVDSSETTAISSLPDINLDGIELADLQANTPKNPLPENNVPERVIQKSSSIEQDDSEVDEVKREFIARINDIIQKGKVLDFPSLYGSLRIGDSLLVTPATTLRNDYRNVVVLTVMRTEDIDTNLSQIISNFTQIQGVQRMSL